MVPRQHPAANRSQAAARPLGPHLEGPQARERGSCGRRWPRRGGKRPGTATHEARTQGGGRRRRRAASGWRITREPLPRGTRPGALGGQARGRARPAHGR
eukprot:8399589-Heterocapsa_arctica.AAC.1